VPDAAAPRRPRIGWPGGMRRQEVRPRSRAAAGGAGLPPPSRGARSRAGGQARLACGPGPAPSTLHSAWAVKSSPRLGRRPRRPGARDAGLDTWRGAERRSSPAVVPRRELGAGMAGSLACGHRRGHREPIGRRYGG
jgi:hypothetical protein